MTTALTARRAILAPGKWVRNELWRRARAVPSLDLRFAESKSLADAVTGQSLVTFTRASSGTYVGSDGLIKTATTNEPRFDHNPTTGESLGLLVEEQRTNSWTYSEQFENEAWTKTDTTVTVNSATAPDGATTASKITSTATTAVHSISRQKAVVSPSWVTVYLKAAEYTICDVYDLNVDTGFRIDLLTGALSESPAFVGKFKSGRYNVNSAGNGWFRVQVGFATSDATTNNPVRIYPNGAQSYLGDGTSGIYLWGAQLEAGAFPTSYIPTTTATVTRSADVASISGSNFSAWFNATQSTIYSEADSSTGAAYSGYVYTIGPSFNDSITHYRQSDSQPVACIRTASADEYGATGNGAVWTGTSVNKFALGVSTSSGRQASNGALSTVSDDTSITFPSMSSMTIGALVGGSLALNGHLRRLAYWPTRLSNAILQALTR